MSLDNFVATYVRDAAQKIKDCATIQIPTAGRQVPCTELQTRLIKFAAEKVLIYVNQEHHPYRVKKGIEDFARIPETVKTYIKLLDIVQYCQEKDYGYSPFNQYALNDTETLDKMAREQELLHNLASLGLVEETGFVVTRKQVREIRKKDADITKQPDYKNEHDETSAFEMYRITAEGKRLFLDDNQSYKPVLLTQTPQKT